MTSESTSCTLGLAVLHSGANVHDASRKTGAEFWLAPIPS
jgi:hypothetical protein